MVVAFHLSAQVEHPRSRTQVAYDQIRADLFGLFVCLLAVGRRNDPATLHQDRSEEQTELRIVDGDQKVLGDQFNPVPGLFATGNCSGGRFGEDYFTPLFGASIGMCITLGRECGKSVVDYLNEEAI